MYSSNKNYYLADEKDYTPHLQGGLVLPLAFDLVEEQNKKELLSNCTDREREKYSPTLQWECFAFGDCPNLGVWLF